MRDLQLIESDILIAREHIKKLNEFLKDKPFLKDSFEFILKTLSEKIKALESIAKKECELKERAYHAIQYNEVLVKTSMLEKVWFAKRQFQLRGKTESQMKIIEEAYREINL